MPTDESEKEIEKLEQLYFGNDRKLGKQERKMASAKDRSIYKKTDDKQLKKKQQLKETTSQELLKGRVISIASEGIMVDFEGNTFQCVLRGLFKKEKTDQKNLVIVGDFVKFFPNGENEGVITQVEPRKSTLSRADNLSQRKKQLIAANIDLVMITTSVVNPPLKQPLIDRYIIAAEKGNMQPIILVNKVDLLNSAQESDAFLEQEKALYQEFLQAYKLAGIPVIGVSVITGEGIEELISMMKDKASVFSGQSGVGKSSLINRLTGLNLRTGEIVEKTKKGSHTTSTANLIPLPFGGWCIDTPGIKSFGVWDLQKEELLAYFPEIMSQGEHCKFPNCTHVHEPGCAIQEGLEQGNISPLRYLSYRSILQSLSEEHLRR